VKQIRIVWMVLNTILHKRKNNLLT